MRVGGLLNGFLELTCVRPVRLAHAGMNLDRQLLLSCNPADLEKQVILKCFYILCIVAWKRFIRVRIRSIGWERPLLPLAALS